MMFCSVGFSRAALTDRPAQLANLLKAIYRLVECITKAIIIDARQSGNWKKF